MAKNSGIVSSLSEKFSLLKSLLLPFILGALCSSFVMSILPEAMGKITAGQTIDNALAMAFTDFMTAFFDQFKPFNDFESGLIMPPLLGGVVFAGLYGLFKGGNDEKMMY